MALIRTPDPEYKIICIIKDTSYINKDSTVYDMSYSLHMPMGAVTISMLYVIYILNFTLCTPRFCFVFEILLYTFPVQG